MYVCMYVCMSVYLNLFEHLYNLCIHVRRVLLEHMRYLGE